MNDSVLQFYEDLSEDYHLLFADWKEAVFRHGEVLDGIIRAQLGDRPLTILDCSCGIGTQAIGLALRGYRVHATDLSPSAVARAERQAREFGAALTLGIADMRQLETQVEGTFDVVLSCDNAVPHLVSDHDLALAAQNMWSKTEAGGLLLISTRDYDELVGRKPRFMATNIVDAPEGRRVVFQVWDWHSDERTYTLHHFIVRQYGGDWITTHRKTVYRALLAEELSSALNQAGFSQITRHPGAETGFLQPIVTARKRG